MTEKRKKERKVKGTITIGTDPEFLLLDKNGSICDASKHEFFSSTSPTSKIGCDGSQTPVEIRPSPVPITNIGLLFNDIKIILSRYIFIYRRI